MSYEAYEDERIIIQEGTKGISMYYIASGSVHVEVSISRFWEVGIRGSRSLTFLCLCSTLILRYFRVQTHKNSN